MGADDFAAGTLTERQEQVIRLIASGKTNFEVAQALGITLDGAKWHLREIMARFGCDTREEAVVIWRARTGMRRRLWFVPPSTLAWKIVAASASAAVGVLFVALTIASRSDNRGNQANLVGIVETPTSAVSATPQAIALRSCGTTTFHRPAISEMQQAFTNPRFGGGTDGMVDRPSPIYFPYYLSNVYRITPRAVSANVENVALSGVQQNGDANVLIPASPPCDHAFRQELTLHFYEFWFIDLLPESAELKGETLTIRTEDLPGSFTNVMLPDPPSTATATGFGGLPPFEELRVVDRGGRVRYTSGASGTAQYTADGGLVFAAGSSQGPLKFELRGAPQVIVAYVPSFAIAVDSKGNADPAATRDPAAADTTVVTDSAGNVLPSAALDVAPPGWQEIFRRELPPDVYSFEKGWILVLPANTPLP